MAFQSINELEQFRYDDCIISELTIADSQIKITVDALIVARNNSQNTSFTESYADTASVRLVAGKLVSAVREGYKYYDANDVLLREVPDEPLEKDAIDAVIKMCEGAYMYSVEKEQEIDGKPCYSFGIELADEAECAMGDSYRLSIVFEKAIVSWERYLNRVQNS